MKFFVPFARSAAQREQIYTECVKNAAIYPLAHPEARIRRLRFKHDGDLCVAEVGRELDNDAGTVVGIVETTALVSIHTQEKDGEITPAIFLSPDDIEECVYFDDFPTRKK